MAKNRSIRGRGSLILLVMSPEFGKAVVSPADLREPAMRGWIGRRLEAPPWMLTVSRARDQEMGNCEIRKRQNGFVEGEREREDQFLS